ncbi:transcriptional regulator, TetR family [Mariniphaga anaerophila]|uniref:Transcriptional regulator, TetR family n=1 Tax=Mariniphaga anaerophila TaxID=1484053 RepID=A0A1M5FFB5_9BACT|nr:TetR/AcrR family transcriptional regulator [Mariniphaga anaerophila]SHF90230.1 transcriptional regulator, TetR family [Mariniphaga anaerophila]
MSQTKKDNTEDKILEAAKTVFIKKGMDGSRMQEIADEAGINKALLHYYFRTKQKLFEAIFSRVFKQIFPDLTTFIRSELPIEKKLETFIEKYITLLMKNPFLPAFILKEIHRDPTFLAAVIKKNGINPTEVFAMLNNEMEAGRIRKMDPRELLMNILALSIFPVAARPLVQIMLFDNNKKEYTDFLERRKQTVKEFIFNSILIK